MTTKQHQYHQQWCKWWVFRLMVQFFVCFFRFFFCSFGPFNVQYQFIFVNIFWVKYAFNNHTHSNDLQFYIFVFFCFVLVLSFFLGIFFFFSLESCCYCCLSQKNKQTNRMIFFKYEILWKRFSVWLFFFSHKSVYFVNGKEDVRYISKNCLQFFVVVFVLNVLSYLNFNFSWIAMICLCVQKLQQTKHTIIFELGVVLCCCKSLSNLLGLGREEGERQKDW